MHQEESVAAEIPNVLTPSASPQKSKTHETGASDTTQTATQVIRHEPKIFSDRQKIDGLWREMADLNEELQRTRAALAAAQREIRDLVRLDELTGLPNYHAFVERISEEVRRAARFEMPLSILLLDLDNFDDLRVRLGEDEAQNVLRSIGFTLQNRTRSVDIVARYGTHQFGAILPNTPQAGAILLAERLCLAIESQEVQGPNLSASFGITTVTSDHLDGKTCIAQAYKAMRHSALCGHNRITHAHSAGIQRVLPWGEVPSVQLINSVGEFAVIGADANRAELDIAAFNTI